MSLTEAMSSFNLFIAFALFILYCLVESFDSSLTLSIARHESLKAANKTLILYIILGVEVLAFVSNYLYAIPIALGAWLGTYLLLEREKQIRPVIKTAKE